MEAEFDQIAKNHSSSIHNIEVQLGQLANAMTIREQGNLPSNTETNPRDVKAITLQSGKELKSQNEGENKATSRKAVVERDSNEKKEEETMGKSVETNEDKVPSSSLLLAPKIPFPHRLRK